MAEQRLFISHASEDEAVVNRIVAYLEARGVACWISSRDIPPRAIYADAITEAMQACSACVVVLTKESNPSKAVKRELELASHYDKPFIPIRIDGTEPAAGVDYYLRNTQWLDFGRQGERALDRIVGQQTPAQSGAVPQTPAPLPKANSLPRPVMVLGGVAIAVVAAFAVWTLTRPNEQSATSDPNTPIALAASALSGSYSWDGVLCGDGPVVSRDGDTLVFTMQGEPTFRHEVLSSEIRSAQLTRFRTRVSEPTDHRGERYTIDTGVLGGIVVKTGGEENYWLRCPDAARP